MRRVLSLLFVIAFAVASAQAQEGPKEFYPNNFVQDQGGALPADSGAILPRMAGAPGSVSTSEQVGPRATAPSSEVPPPVATAAISTEEPTGYPVVSIGAVLNSKDQKHYLESLEEIWRVAARFDFDIGKIYTIGDMKNMANAPIAHKLIARGARIAVLDELPMYPKLEHSPTWIVSIEQGDVVLDGVGDLEGYFTTKGQFRAKFRPGVTVVNEEPPAAEAETSEEAP